MTNKRAPFASAIAALVLATGVVTPALAGPAEVALLSNYIGEWSGAGVLQGGDTPEPFTCRLTIDKGNQAKINYAGRCTLVNMPADRARLAGRPVARIAAAAGLRERLNG